MHVKFDQLVEEVRSCSLEEKEQLKVLLERALVEDQRQVFLRHYLESQDDLKEGRLKFSSHLADLKNELGNS
jgi:hypothetical protein